MLPIWKKIYYKEQEKNFGNTNQVSQYYLDLNLLE
jgi:hypothetical protein